MSNISELSLVRSIVRESFFDFVKEFWSESVPEDYIDNWHIEYLCNELQIVAERVFRGEPKKYDLIINISPGSTKSTIASVMFPAWIWTRMISARVIGGSYAHLLSMELSRRNRDIIISDKYRKCFPSVQLREDQNTKGHFANTKGGSRYSVGTGGAVTGMHAHFIIVDDPINPNEAVSDKELKTTNLWMSETLSTRKVDKLIVPTILIMQRLHQDDPTAHMIENAVVPPRHICFPAELIESETVPIEEQCKPASARFYYKKGLMDPRRLSRIVLQESAKNLGEFGYAGQMLQRPAPIGGGWFKVERLIVELPLVSTKWVRLVRFWDKAGTRDGGAYTVGFLMGLDQDGRFWILDLVRGQWESGSREKIIKNTAISDGRGVIIGIEQEPGSGGKQSAEATVKNLAGFRVRVDRPTGDKTTRADPWSVQVNIGNVSMKPAPWNSDVVHEMAAFPVSKYKDIMDSGSGAFNILTTGGRRVGGLSVLNIA